jgi:thiamine transport system ATP-binding protein
MLEIANLTVRYGDIVAVDDITLHVPDGRVVCILGPSGGGKSTLLRAVAGLEQPTAGSIRWDGNDLAGVPTHRRKFGLMFQDHALFPHKDALGNVAFGLRMTGAGRADAERAARGALEHVGLGGFDGRRVHEMSGGEQQRVALARSLAPNPRLLMLDEPLGSLDRALRERLVADLHRLFVAESLTALFVTHDQDEAFALADTVVIVRAGRIEQQGSPEEVWRAPQSEFTARFLGFSNFVTGRANGGVATCALGAVPTTLDGAVVVAARPDAIQLGEQPVPGALAATVLDATFRRDHFLVRARTDSSTGPSTDVGIIEVDSATPNGAGTPVWLTLDPSLAVVLSPAETPADTSVDSAR